MQNITSDAETVAKAKLGEYKLTLDARIDEYSRQLIDEWRELYGEYSVEGLQAFTGILSRGGKRMRGALVLNSYEMHGGEDTELALEVARIIEMIHAYLLVLDDVSDRSDGRRGGPTAHKYLEALHHDQRMHGDSAHFGIAQAINSSLIGAHTAMRDITRLKASDSVKVALLGELNDTLIVTANGQMNDIFNEALQDIDEERVRQVLMSKTAYYSFLNPLRIGGLLAGADTADLMCLEDYSMNAGLSFQITDDILGTFGDSFESGKSALDDLREGKITILVARALAHANPDQKRHLLASLGNDRLSTDDYEDCRRIIENTGALKYAKRLADKYAKDAIAGLNAAPSSWQQRNVLFLRGLAKYIATRSA